MYKGWSEKHSISRFNHRSLCILRSFFEPSFFCKYSPEAYLPIVINRHGEI